MGASDCPDDWGNIPLPKQPDPPAAAGRSQRMTEEKKKRDVQNKPDPPYKITHWPI